MIANDASVASGLGQTLVTLGEVGHIGTSALAVPAHGGRYDVTLAGAEGPPGRDSLLSGLVTEAAAAPVKRPTNIFTTMRRPHIIAVRTQDVRAEPSWRAIYGLFLVIQLTAKLTNTIADIARNICSMY